MKPENLMKPIEETKDDEKCLECNEGFIEKDGGIIQEVCTACSGTGIKDFVKNDGCGPTLEELMTKKLPHLADIPIDESGPITNERFQQVKTPLPPVLKKGQYFCTKCQTAHKADGKIGVRHLKHKA